MVSNDTDSNKWTVFKIKLDGGEKTQLGMVTNIGNIEIVKNMMLTSTTIFYSHPELNDYESERVALFLDQNDKEKNQKKIDESEADIMSKLKSRAQRVAEEKKKREEEEKKQLLQLWYGTWYNFRSGEKFTIDENGMGGIPYQLEDCKKVDDGVEIYYKANGERWKVFISEDGQEYGLEIYNSEGNTYMGTRFSACRDQNKTLPYMSIE